MPRRSAMFRPIASQVPWNDFPMFILNKGICLAAFILLTLNFALGPTRNLGIPVPQGWLNARKALGMTGFLLVMVHVLMSFLLFSLIDLKEPRIYHMSRCRVARQP